MSVASFTIGNCMEYFFIFLSALELVVGALLHHQIASVPEWTYCLPLQDRHLLTTGKTTLHGTTVK